MASTATILNGASLSDAIDLGVGPQMVGIQMPAAWTAADMTFQASVDGATYANLTDDAGTEVTFTVSASKFVTLRTAALDLFYGKRYLKLRSGTAGAATNQGADRAIKVFSQLRTGSY